MAVAGVVLAGAAWAQQAYFSGPSVVRLQEAAVFSGKGFTPNAAMNVALDIPGGQSAVYGAVTGADGSLSYTLVATLAGTYTLRVTDGGGRTLATAPVVVLP